MGKISIKEPYGFIYITTNMINGKRYIGQKKFDKTWINYLGSGHVFKKAIKKYGKENFHRDIVSIAYSKEELDLLEKQWIYNYNATNDDNFYNIAEGGNGNPREGYSENDIEKWKNKISESKKGKNTGENSPNWKRVFSDEWKNKISENHAVVSGENNPRATKVVKLDLQGNLICIYNTIKEASDSINLDYRNISNTINGRQKTCGGFKWVYYEDYLKLINKI